MDVGRAEAAERELDGFIRRAAEKLAEDRPGQTAANELEEHWRTADLKYEAAARLVNARAWAAYFGGLALASHDAAARYAQKRDEALALVRDLEAGGGGTAA
ncbi:MAG: hypothetical protein CYG60_02230 [Actinobacteria bacterium]|nr:MAG: hypothetical protein CYG60_02230 [Actinomycetota bacterium]